MGHGFHSKLFNYQRVHTRVNVYIDMEETLK
jgi:hypothetical protein